MGYKHGQTWGLTWRSWVAMRQRCQKLDDGRYGGRGIQVNSRWLGKTGFANFLSDMGERPSAAHSLERIDNNGDYEPENCRWATADEQSRNKRNNIWITIDGETMTAKDWARRKGINYYTLMKRIYHGWDPIEAVTRPLR
jgi:hypothetical protein